MKRDDHRRRPDERAIQHGFNEEMRLAEMGEHPRMRLLTVRFRIGSSFYSIWLLLPPLIVGTIVAIVIAKFFYGNALGQAWLQAHPPVPSYPAVTPGDPAWMRWLHLLNFFFMIMIVRAGLQILADHPRLYLHNDCTPNREWLRFRKSIPPDRLASAPPERQWTAKDDAVTLTPVIGLPGGRHTIGIARHWHFLFDILFVVNGLVFIIIAFATGYWKWLIPTTWSIFPDAVSCLLTYTSLHHVSGPNAFFHLNGLQQLSYFGVIYILAPLALLTGIAQSPALDNRFKWYQRLFGNRQTARSLHFLIMLCFVAFYAVHMLMVMIEPNFPLNLNHITLGVNKDNFDGLAIFMLVLVIVIAFNVWAVRLSWTHTRILQRLSNLTVGRLMDLLFDRSGPRATYREEDISPYFWPNGLVPTSDEWRHLRDTGFHDYRLRVYGLVENPVELSLDELKELTKQDQITMHNCIQGWSGIAKWGGLPFQRLIELVQP
ncbi:MAG: cytochrome b/b6 domain-containing protein, partial [Candidatus Dormibacteraceae bacterium]